MNRISDISELPKEHPLKRYHQEKDLTVQLLKEIKTTDPKTEGQKFYNIFNQLQTIEKRFERKENQLFPYLEEGGWTSHTQRMWSFHDTLRAQFRILRKKIEEREYASVSQDVIFLIDGINRLLRMEEDILFPYSLEKLSEENWNEISKGEKEIGWMVKEISTEENPQEEKITLQDFKRSDTEFIKNNPHFDEGYMSLEQVNLLLKTIPFDITYVDENDKVIFYNRGEERLFPRSPGIIGREVKFCHPPKSVGTVLRILEEFRKGNKNEAGFWINIKGRLIYIRYFAVRDADRNYKGVVEVSQDISDIKNIEGERRLLDWN